MRVPLPTRDDLRKLASLALPITFIQVAMMAMGVEDCMIVGRYSAAGLAGIAIGSLWFFMVSSLGFGLLLGLEPVISQAVGANDPAAIARGFQRGLVLVGVVGTAALATFLPAEGALRAMGQAASIVAIAGPYLRVTALSIYPFLLFILLRVVLQARGITRPIVFTILVANVVNVVLSILLVFGGWGFPRMGPVGSGVGTLIARFVMVVTLVGSAWDELRPLMAWRRDTLALAPFWRVIQIGLPIAAGIELEFGVFAVVGLFMGHLGPVPMAAHQVALNISSLTFMVPLGIGSAGSVLVGRAIGAEDPTSARRTAVAALTCGVGFMGVSALVLTFAPRLIAGAYTNDPATLALAASLIPIAGVFQVFDGTQTVSIGLLRGAGDTRTPMIVNLLGYWLIGLPISIWLGARLGMGPQGYWWGLVVGLAFVGIALAARVRVRMGGQLERLHIDHPHTGPAAH